MPAGMLAPSALETTGPAARSASAISRVVVVLPLVADTRTTSRCCASRASRSGSSLSATWPPITDPLPRPAARDTAAAALPAVTASLARGDSGSELPAIVLDPPCVASAPSLSRSGGAATGSLTGTVADHRRRSRRRGPYPCGHAKRPIPGSSGLVRAMSLLGDPVLHTPCEDVTDFGPHSPGWSRTCSRRCTRRRAWASPRTRSASRCGCSSTTARTTRTSAISDMSSTRVWSRRTG